MAFDSSAAYSIVQTDSGQELYEQGGTYYKRFSPYDAVSPPLQYNQSVDASLTNPGNATAIAAAALAGNIAAGLAVDGTGLAYLAGNNVFTGANRFQSIGVGFTPATTASGYGPSLFTAMGQIASTSAGDAHYVYFGARHNGSDPIRNSTYGGAAIYIDQGTWIFNRFVGATAGSAIAMTSSLVLDNNGNVVPGTSSALATNATNGFMYLTSMAGIPGGTPTAYTSRVPIVIDSTNLKLMAYIGGAWKGVTLA